MEDEPVPGASPATYCRIAGVLLMLGWAAAFFFELGPTMIRPVYLIAGALLCWWGMRTAAG